MKSWLSNGTLVARMYSWKSFTCQPSTTIHKTPTPMTFKSESSFSQWIKWVSTALRPNWTWKRSLKSSRLATPTSVMPITIQMRSMKSSSHVMMNAEPFLSTCRHIRLSNTSLKLMASRKLAPMIVWRPLSASHIWGKFNAMKSTLKTKSRKWPHHWLSKSRRDPQLITVIRKLASRRSRWLALRIFFFTNVILNHQAWT